MGTTVLTRTKKIIPEIAQMVKDLYQRYPTVNLMFGGNYNMVMAEWLDRYPSKYQRHFCNPVLLDVCRVFNFERCVAYC